MDEREVLLEENLERALLSLKAAGAGLWEYNIDTDRIRCNRRWYSIMGLHPLEQPIRSLSDFREHIHPDDSEIATSVDLAEVDQLLLNDHRYHVEFRIIRPSGEVRWIRSVACVIVDPDTLERRAVGCVTDITEFKEGTSPRALSSPSTEKHSGSINGEIIIEHAVSNAPVLTSKERECLMWVSVGKTAWETAKIIGRSRRTVEFHLNNAVNKLKAANKIHAAAMAIRAGLI